MDGHMFCRFLKPSLIHVHEHIFIYALNQNLNSGLVSFKFDTGWGSGSLNVKLTSRSFLCPNVLEVHFEICPSGDSPFSKKNT